MPPKCLSYMKTLSFLLIKYALIILIIMLSIVFKENTIITCLYNISTGIKVHSWARLVVTFKNIGCVWKCIHTVKVLKQQKTFGMWGRKLLFSDLHLLESRVKSPIFWLVVTSKICDLVSSFLITEEYSSA